MAGAQRVSSHSQFISQNLLLSTLCFSLCFLLVGTDSVAPLADIPSNSTASERSLGNSHPAGIAGDDNSTLLGNTDGSKIAGQQQQNVTVKNQQTPSVSTTSAVISQQNSAGAVTSGASPQFPSGGGVLPGGALQGTVSDWEKAKGHNRNCSLTLPLKKGPAWEYDNCIYLPHAGGFFFHWTYDRPSRTLDASVSAPTACWLGWGVGVRMVGSSAVVAFDIDGGGRPFFAQYFLKSMRDARQNRPWTGQLDLVNNSAKVAFQDGAVFIMFALTLPPSQSNGLYMFMAKGTGANRTHGVLSPHRPQDTVRTYITLTGGGPPTWLQNLHGVVNTLAWGLMLPIGVLVARHAREFEPVWLLAHRSIQAIGFGAGSFGFFLGLLMWGEGEHETHHHGNGGIGSQMRRGGGGDEEEVGEGSPGRHRTIGITLFVLACFQVTAFFAHPHKDAILRPWWNLLHHWTGRAVLLLGILNCWEGISLLQPSSRSDEWALGFGIPFGLLVVVASILEAFSLWTWLMDDAPSTWLQRWVQSHIPPTIHRRYTSLHSSSYIGEEAEVAGVPAAAAAGGGAGVDGSVGIGGAYAPYIGGSGTLEQREIEVMASRFRHEMEYKYT